MSCEGGHAASPREEQECPVRESNGSHRLLGWTLVSLINYIVEQWFVPLPLTVITYNGGHHAIHIKRLSISAAWLGTATDSTASTDRDFSALSFMSISSPSMQHLLQSRLVSIVSPSIDLSSKHYHHTTIITDFHWNNRSLKQQDNSSNCCQPNSQRQQVTRVNAVVQSQRQHY